MSNDGIAVTDFNCRQKFAYREFHIPFTDRRPRAGYRYQVNR